MAKRISVSRLPKQRKKTAEKPEQPKKKYNQIDPSMVGRYIDHENRQYDVVRAYCKHKDGIDEWLEWAPHKGGFSNRIFMPLDEDVLRNKIESGDLKKTA